jgi:hypothetical protein
VEYKCHVTPEDGPTLPTRRQALAYEYPSFKSKVNQVIPSVSLLRKELMVKIESLITCAVASHGFEVASHWFR